MKIHGKIEIVYVTTGGVNAVECWHNNQFIGSIRMVGPNPRMREARFVFFPRQQRWGTNFMNGATSYSSIARVKHNLETGQIDLNTGGRVDPDAPPKYLYDGDPAVTQRMRDPVIRGRPPIYDQKRSIGVFRNGHYVGCIMRFFLRGVTTHLEYGYVPRGTRTSTPAECMTITRYPTLMDVVNDIENRDGGNVRRTVDVVDPRHEAIEQSIRDAKATREALGSAAGLPQRPVELPRVIHDPTPEPLFEVADEPAPAYIMRRDPVVPDAPTPPVADVAQPPSHGEYVALLLQLRTALLCCMDGSQENRLRPMMIQLNNTLHRAGLAGTIET